MQTRLAEHSVARLVLEGLPGAGKTTVAEGLSRRLGIPMIPEWVVSESLPSGASPDPPPYLQNDLAKERLARRIDAPLLLLDRHYFGALAFSCGMDSAPEGLRPPGESAEQNRQMYREALGREELSPPACLVILDVPAPLSLQRQPRARRTIRLFGHAGALEAMRAYYAQLTGPFAVHLVDATRDPEEVARAAEAIALTCLRRSAAARRSR